MAAVRDILITSLLIALLLGSASGVLIGIGLAARAQATLQFFRRMNRWGLSWLDIKAREERPVPGSTSLSPMKRNIAGTAFVLGGGFAAYVLTVSAKAPAIVVERVWGKVSIVSLLLVEVIRWILVVGCVFAVVVGVLLLFFPEAWTRLEAVSNRWKSTSGFFNEADAMHTPVDRWVESSPRTAGIVIAALSVVSVAAFGALLYLRALHRL
jgi:hypothetical protein